MADETTVFKTTEKLETAKAFQYKTSVLDRLLNERDGFDPVNDDFHAELFKYAYKNAINYNNVMVQHNGRPLGIEFKSNHFDQYTMLTPDMSEPGRFRASYFDKQGFSGHNVYDTIPEAVEEMVRDGYFAESKGILAELQQSPEFEIGNRISTLIGQFNIGKISHQELSEQRQAIHNDVNNKKLYSLIESGANIDQLLSAIIQHEQTPLLSSVATLLQHKQITATVELDTANNQEDDYLGLYKDGKPPKILLKSECGELLSQVLLHECIHAVTYDAIRSGNKASNIYVKRLSEIKQHARKELMQKGIDPENYYGLSRESHLEELITEIFTDADLRQVLQQVSSKTAKGTKYSDTIKTMYDEIIQIVNNIIGGEEKHHPVIKELMEIGAGLIIVNDKYTGATMNMIINDRGETVAAVGNEISIARAKVRWPNLIEEIQEEYKNHPRYREQEPINLIAKQNIRNTYEAQAILDAAILPLIENSIIPEKRITIDPDKYAAMFVPTKFNVGDPVTFINDYGVVFENRTITGIDKNYGKENRYFMTPNEAHWFSSKESNFTSLTLDQIILDKLERLFPEDKQDQDGQVTIDLIPPNGRDFYERLTIQPINPDDSGILPANSFHIKHFAASPATGNMLSDSEQIKQEFTFSVKDGKINPYWMQNEGFYYDLLPPQKTNATENISTDEMRHNLNVFASEWLARIEVKNIIDETAPNDLLTTGYKQSAIDSFANKGIILADVSVKDYVWTHEPYLLTEDVKDLEIRIFPSDETTKQLLADKSATFAKLTPTEAKELTDFTTAITKAYPTADPEKLTQLCTIASDMQKYTIQNANGVLSNEHHTSLTDNQEKQVKELIKDLPHVLPSFPYADNAPAIKLYITGGQVINVPEIPKNKLELAPVTTCKPTAANSKKR